MPVYIVGYVEVETQLNNRIFSNFSSLFLKRVRSKMESKISRSERLILKFILILGYVSGCFPCRSVNLHSKWFNCEYCSFIFMYTIVMTIPTLLLGIDTVVSAPNLTKIFFSEFIINYGLGVAVTIFETTRKVFCIFNIHKTIRMFKLMEEVSSGTRNIKSVLNNYFENEQKELTRSRVSTIIVLLMVTSVYLFKAGGIITYDFSKEDSKILRNTLLPEEPWGLYVLLFILSCTSSVASTIYTFGIIVLVGNSAVHDFQVICIRLQELIYASIRDTSHISSDKLETVQSNLEDEETLQIRRNLHESIKQFKKLQKLLEYFNDVGGFYALLLIPSFSIEFLYCLYLFWNSSSLGQIVTTTIGIFGFVLVVGNLAHLGTNIRKTVIVISFLFCTKSSSSIRIYKPI